MNLKLLILLVSSSLIVAASAISANALALAHSLPKTHHEAIAPGTRLGERAASAPLSSLAQAQPALLSQQGCSCPNCLSLSLSLTEIIDRSGCSTSPWKRAIASILFADIKPQK